jgi:hypothetical protein
MFWRRKVSAKTLRRFSPSLSAEKNAGETPHPHNINTLPLGYSAILFSTMAEREVL